MTEFNEITENIRLCVEAYDNCHLSDVPNQSEILLKLTSNLFYLEAHRVKARNEWLNAYNSFDGNNAQKERHADNEVKELYMIRRLMTSAYKVTDSLRSTISIFKKEQ